MTGEDLAWWTLGVSLSTFAFTKTLEQVLSLWKEKAAAKREFKQVRRAHMLQELEALKETVGHYYELAAHWRSYETKEETYKALMSQADELIGKYNKYPKVASAARDVLHWGGLVAYNERAIFTSEKDLKKELAEKFREFLKVCNDQVAKLA